jgi:hypothetical protein
MDDVTLQDCIRDGITDALAHLDPRVFGSTTYLSLEGRHDSKTECIENAVAYAMSYIEEHR